MKTALTILGVVVIGGLIWWLVARNGGDIANVNGDSNGMVCTMDVRECADGSFVGRDPQNNCEFRACPDGSIPTDNGVDEDEIIFDKG